MTLPCWKVEGFFEDSVDILFTLYCSLDNRYAEDVMECV